LDYVRHSLMTNHSSALFRKSLSYHISNLKRGAEGELCRSIAERQKDRMLRLSLSLSLSLFILHFSLFTFHLLNGHHQFEVLDGGAIDKRLSISGFFTEHGCPVPVETQRGLQVIQVFLLAGMFE
jgi:hypothetical protein